MSAEYEHTEPPVGVEPATSAVDIEATTTDRVVAGARWMSAGQASVQITRTIVSVVLARLLVPDAFGLLALAVIVTQFIDLFMDLGTSAAVIQRRNLTRQMASSIFVLNGAVGALLAVAMIVLAPAIADLYDTPDIVPVIRVMSIAVVISSLALVQQAMLRRHMRFAAIALANLATALTNGLVAIPLAAAGAGVWALVAGVICGAAAAAFVVWRSSRWVPILHFSAADLREVASFSGNLSLFNLIGFAIANADKLIVGRFLGAGALGVYALADRTLMYPVRTVTRVIQEVLFPALSRVQDDNASIRRGYLRACSVIALVAFPAMFGLAAVSGPFVRVVLGERWADAIPLVTVLAPAGAVQAMSHTGGILYRAKGRTDLLFRWGLVAGSVIVGSYVIGLRWGLTGVGVAYGTALVVLAAPALIIPFRLVDLRFTTFLRTLIPYAVSSLVMVILVVTARVALERNGTAEVIVLASSIAVGASVYTVMMLLFRPPALGDLAEVAGVRTLARRFSR